VAPPYVMPEPSAISVRSHADLAEASGAALPPLASPAGAPGDRPSAAEPGRVELPKIRLSSGPAPPQAPHPQWAPRPGPTKRTPVPRVGYFDVVPDWDGDALPLDTSPLSPNLRFLRLQMTRLEEPAGGGRARGSPSGAAGEAPGGDVVQAGPASGAFTAKHPTAVTLREVEAEEAVPAEQLAEFVANLRPRTVVDLQPLLVLAQGLLRRLVSDRLVMFKRDNVALEDELSSMRARLHETVEKLRSASDAIQALQRRPEARSSFKRLSRPGSHHGSAAPSRPASREGRRGHSQAGGGGDTRASTPGPERPGGRVAFAVGPGDAGGDSERGSEFDPAHEDLVGLRANMQDILATVQGMDSGRDPVRRQKTHKKIDISRLVESEELQDALKRLKELGRQLREERNLREDLQRKQSTVEAQRAAAEKLREIKQRETAEHEKEIKAMRSRMQDLEHINERLNKLAGESDVSVSHALKRLSEQELAVWIQEFDPASFDFDFSDLTLKQMKELLGELGAAAACHIIAQGPFTDGCRLLLSTDQATFDVMAAELSVEALASFFLVKDKAIFNLLDHRLAQSRATIQNVSQAVAVIVTGQEFVEKAIRGQGMRELRKWLAQRTGNVKHAPMFALAAWKLGHTHAIHSAINGAVPELVADMLTPLPASIRANLLGRLDDEGVAAALAFMDEVMVAHTLVEMPEARVPAVIALVTRGDDHQLQKVFAATAEYQHARKGLYRATQLKVLDQLTKVFDSKEVQKTEAVTASVDFTELLRSVVAFEEQLEGQLRGSLEEMETPTDVALWVAMNGPIAAVLATPSLKAADMLAAAMGSLPRNTVGQFLSFALVGALRFVTQWQPDAALGFLRGMRACRLGALLGSTSIEMGPTWAEGIAAAMERDADLTKAFKREVESHRRLWLEAHELIDEIGLLKDSGKARRALRDTQAEAALRLKVSLEVFDKRVSAKDVVQKFLHEKKKEDRRRKSRPDAFDALDEDVDPEVATQNALRELVTTKGIGVAVRMSEELVLREKMKSEMEAKDRGVEFEAAVGGGGGSPGEPNKGIKGASSAVPRSIERMMTKTKRRTQSVFVSGNEKEFIEDSYAQDSVVKGIRDVIDEEEGSRGPPMVTKREKRLSVPIQRGGERRQLREKAEREDDPQKELSDLATRLGKVLLSMDSQCVAELLLGLIKTRPDLAALLLTRLPRERAAEVHACMGARQAVLVQYMRDQDDDSRFARVEDAIGRLQEATSPQLLVEHLGRIAKLLLTHYHVRLSVLEVVHEEGSTTKARTEIRESKAVWEVIRLASRFGLPSVTANDLMQLSPEVDVLFTSELEAGASRRAQQLHAKHTPGGDDPMGDSSANLGGGLRAARTRMKAREGSRRTLDSREGAPAGVPPPSPPGLGAAREKPLSVGHLHQLTTLYGALARTRDVAPAYRKLAEAVKGGAFTAGVFEGTVAALPVWRDAPAMGKKRWFDAGILGCVVATANAAEGTDGGACEMCSVRPDGGGYYAELAGDRHRDWQAVILLQQVSAELTIWLAGRGKRTPDMVAMEEEMQSHPGGLVELRDDDQANRAAYGTLSKMVTWQIKSLTERQRELQEIKGYREPTEKVFRIVAAMHALLHPGDSRLLNGIDVADSAQRDKVWSTIKARISFEASDPKNYLVLIAEASSEVKMGGAIHALKEVQVRLAMDLLESVSHEEAVKTSATLAEIRQWVMIVVNSSRLANEIESEADARGKLVSGGWLQRNRDLVPEDG